MVGVSHLSCSGLLLVFALLPLALDGQPAAPPQELHTAPAAPTAPSRIMQAMKGRGGGCLGPKNDGKNPSSPMGCKPNIRPQPAPSAPSRIMRDLRPDSKQSEAAWDRMVQPEPHAEGAGAGDSSRLQEQAMKGRGGGCFRPKNDGKNPSSPMGCIPNRRPQPPPSAPSRIMQDLRTGKKQSQAA